MPEIVTEAANPIHSVAVSATGAVLYSKAERENVHSRDFFSLHILEQNMGLTLIPEAHTMITNLTFLCVAGKEQLLMVHGNNISLFDLELGTERKLLELAFLQMVHTICATPEDDKALYVCGNPKIFSDSFGVRELLVTPNTHHDSLKTTLRLGLQWVHDSCISEDIFVICGEKASGSCIVAGVKLSDWRVRWKVNLDIKSICPGTSGTVFAVARLRRAIYQLSLQDGTILAPIPLVPTVMNPYSIAIRDKILYVIHPYAALAECNWTIDKFRFFT